MYKWMDGWINELIKATEAEWVDSITDNSNKNLTTFKK